ncbi:MAG: GGDEF domain-containing protein, partial [Proteobacteria bacterium]|nr:GGDEF domain-containing protein [Pseudomonadota bacterium]
KFLNLLDRTLSKLPSSSVVAIALIFLFTIGVVDYWAGADISLSIFYLVPIGMGAWYTGWRTAVFLSVLSAIVNRIDDLGTGFSNQHSWLAIWNVALTLIFMLVFSYLLTLLRGRLEYENHLARTDVLTGVCNRRSVIEKLEYMLELAARERWPVSLIYVDVDDFKQVNDKKGHAEGDKILRLIACKLNDSLRQTDIVGRLGGDEFAMILPHTDRQTAAHLIQDLHRKLEQSLADGGLLATCSMGCVTLHAPISVEMALKEADTLMYQAKKQGKRQVVFAESET